MKIDWLVRVALGVGTYNLLKLNRWQSFQRLLSRSFFLAKALALALWLRVSSKKCSKHLMNYLEPQYNVPFQKTITTRTDALYEINASLLKDILSKPERVAVTTDSLTSLTSKLWGLNKCLFLSKLYCVYCWLYKLLFFWSLM